MLVRIRVALDCSLPAERVLLALRGEPFAFALTGRWAGGGAIVGCAPVARPRRRRGPVRGARGPAARARRRRGRRRLVRLARLRPGRPRRGAPAAPAAPVPAPRRPPGVLRPCPAAGQRGPVVVRGARRERGGGRRGRGGGRRGRARRGGEAGELAPHRARARLAHLRALLAAAPEPAPPAPTTFSLRAPGAAGHVAAVADCVERIAAGEIFQANLCLRLDATYAGDVAELYAHAAPQLRARLRRVLPDAVGRRREPLARALPAPPRPARDHRADQGHRAHRPGHAARLRRRTARST